MHTIANIQANSGCNFPKRRGRKRKEMDTIDIALPITPHMAPLPQVSRIPLSGPSPTGGSEETGPNIDEFRRLQRFYEEAMRRGGFTEQPMQSAEPVLPHRAFLLVEPCTESSVFSKAW